MSSTYLSIYIVTSLALLELGAQRSVLNAESLKSIKFILGIVLYMLVAFSAYYSKSFDLPDTGVSWNIMSVLLGILFGYFVLGTKYSTNMLIAGVLIFIALVLSLM